MLKLRAIAIICLVLAVSGQAHAAESTKVVGITIGETTLNELKDKHGATYARDGVFMDMMVFALDPRQLKLKNVIGAMVVVDSQEIVQVVALSMTKIAPEFEYVQKLDSILAKKYEYVGGYGKDYGDFSRVYKSDDAEISMEGSGEKLQLKYSSDFYNELVFAAEKDAKAAEAKAKQELEAAEVKSEIEELEEAL